jgi:hypothetical protein
MQPEAGSPKSGNSCQAGEATWEDVLSLDTFHKDVGAEAGRDRSIRAGQRLSGK